MTGSWPAPCPLGQHHVRVGYRLAEEHSPAALPGPQFVRLLRDGEAEVRAAAASNIAAVCRLLPVEEVGLADQGKPGEVERRLWVLQNSVSAAAGCWVLRSARRG